MKKEEEEEVNETRISLRFSFLDEKADVATAFYI